ncbi:MAG: ABC transporter ATP-binding protein [Armatimonadetes bacterium]|nr:ABC transporter ATP-binding protein [Armatimonadota bacterium]
MSRLMSDIALAQNFVGSAMTTLWMGLAACGFYLCLLFNMDVPLALASLCVFPFYITSMRTFGRAAKEAQEALEDFSDDVQERAAGIGVVESFAAEGREAHNFFHGKPDASGEELQRAARVFASPIPVWSLATTWGASSRSTSRPEPFRETTGCFRSCLGQSGRGAKTADKSSC